MRIKKSAVLSLVSQTVLGLCCLTPVAVAPVLAQAQGQTIPAGVSMTMYRLNQTPDGKQYFVNNHNQQVFLPGAGAKGDDIPIYTGPQGGVWYVDRNNRPIQISAVTQQGSVQASQPVTNNYYQQPTSSTGSGAIGTAAGAAVGAAAGTMMGAAMYNNQYPAYGTGAYRGAVPYGAAMYYDNNNKPYYVNNGQKTYVNNDVTVNNAHFNNWQNQAAVYDKQVVNQNGAWHGAYNQTAGYQAPYGGVGAANAYQNNQQQQNAEAAARGAEASNAYNNNQQQQNAESAMRGAGASNAYQNNQQQQNADSAAKGAAAARGSNSNGGGRFGGRFGRGSSANSADGAGAAAAARGSDGDGAGAGRFGSGDGAGAGRFGGGDGAGAGRFGGGDGAGAGRFGGGDGAGAGRFGGGDGAGAAKARDGGGRLGGAGGGGRFGGGRRGR